MRKKSTSSKTVMGYLRSIPTTILNQKSASEIMNDAPPELSKKIGTWAQGVSTVRAERRESRIGKATKKNRGTKKVTLGIAPGSFPPVLSVESVKVRVSEAVDQELDRIGAELNTLRESWQKFLQG